MKRWFSNVRAALSVWVVQSVISFDQAVGNGILGFLKVLLAIFTGAPQTPIWADETLSAHCFRAAKARKPMAGMWLAFIDLLFFWQTPDPEVDAEAGRRVTSHCERAYWQEKLRRGVPPEERSVERAP